MRDINLRMKQRFLSALALLLLVTTISTASTNLTNFLEKLSENVTDQICFINFDKPILLDIYSNLFKNAQGNPQIVYKNLKSSSNLSQTYMRKCFLTFLEFDNNQIVSNY